MGDLNIKRAELIVQMLESKFGVLEVRLQASNITPSTNICFLLLISTSYILRLEVAMSVCGR
jgi:hypothetical protein